MKNKNAQKKCILNKIKMNSEIGITMISLVVTVIILFIISSVSMNIGFETYNQTRVRSFVSKMKVIQSKVDMIAEQNDSTFYNNFKRVSNLKTENLDEYKAFQEIIEDYETDDLWDDSYYYFTPDDLESKLGLKDQELTVIINFENRKVIAKKGVKKNGIEYHTQYELAGGDQLINRDTRILFIYPPEYNANSYVKDLKNSFEKVDSISATEIDYNKVANDFKNHSQDAYDVVIYWGVYWAFDSRMIKLYEVGIKTITNGNDSTNDYIVSDVFGAPSTSYNFTKMVSNKVTDLLNDSIQSGTDGQYIIKLKPNWEKWYSATINGNTYDAIGYLKEGKKQWIHIQPVDIVSSDVLKEMINFMLYN